MKQLNFALKMYVLFFMFLYFLYDFGLNSHFFHLFFFLFFKSYSYLLNGNYDEFRFEYHDEVFIMFSQSHSSRKCVCLHQSQQ